MPVERPLVSVALVDGHGAALDSAQHRGRTFFAGERGQRYAVAVTNNTGDRLEVVLSVDGRDAVSGKRADFRKARGYVVGPFETIEVEGFRESLHDVATFRFSSVANSYTARKGTPHNAGVIAVAAFKEKRRHREEWAVPESAPRRSSKAPAPSSSRAKTSQDLGTEFGESRASEVQEVAFLRAQSSRPDFQAALFYDSERGLASRGIRIQHPEFDAEPQPWVSRSDDRFAKPPPPRRY